MIQGYLNKKLGPALHKSQAIFLLAFSSNSFLSDIGVSLYRYSSLGSVQKLSSWLMRNAWTKSKKGNVRARVLIC